MAKNLHKFILPSEEAAHLREAVSEDGILSSTVHSAKVGLEGSLILELEPETAEKLREYLTEQLARIGFDEDYALTKKGAILEALIDRFYIA